jgi:hypothetical protein
VAIVAFDTGMLSLALHQTARFPVDPSTGFEVTKPKQRIERLVSELSKDKATIVIPAPAFAEFLVVVEEAGPEYLRKINKSARFDIEPFDTLAAVEAAAMFRAFKAGGDKRGGATGDWQKIKVDQQIIAVARTRNAVCLYSSDPGVIAICKAAGMASVAVWELPLPDDDGQGELFPPDDGAPFSGPDSDVDPG